MSGKPSSKGRKSSAKNKQKAQPDSGKTGKSKSSGWEFAPFTTKAVAFNAAAKKLAAYLHDLYGESVSIAAFEKFAIAANSFSEQEFAIVTLETEGVSLLMHYQKAREERDAERQAFRSDVQVKDVEGSLVSLLDRCQPKDQSDPKTQGTECAEGGTDSELQQSEADFALQASL